MKNFNFTRLFDNNSKATNKAKQEKRKYGRIARIEELEGREMLSVSPIGDNDDHVNNLYEPIVVASFAEVNSDAKNDNTDALSSAAGPMPAGAVGSLGVITSQRIHNGSVSASTIFRIYYTYATWTFSLAHTGDENSYIESVLKEAIALSTMIPGWNYATATAIG